MKNPQHTPRKATQARRVAPKVKSPTAPVKRNGGPIRWTISKAASECGFQKTQLQTKRVAADVHAGPDGKFSTRQILAMIFGDKQQAETRRAQAEAETAARRNLRETGELIPTAVACAALNPLGIILRQKICASSMTEAEKDEMLADIASGIASIDWEKLAQENRK